MWYTSGSGLDRMEAYVLLEVTLLKCHSFVIIIMGLGEGASVGFRVHNARMHSYYIRLALAQCNYGIFQ